MMISKDAVRYLRSVNGRQYRQYICPFCTSRAISSTSATSQRPNRAPRSSRSYASASLPRQKPLLESTPVSGADLAGVAIGNGNVREYLKKWSQQKEAQDAELGNEVVVDKRPWVPSSLYIRDISALEEVKETVRDTDTESEFLLDDDDNSLIKDTKDIASSLFIYLMPGDVYPIRAEQISPQLGLHLGYIGRQSQAILQNGTWFQGMTVESRGAEVLHDFVSAKEIAKFKQFLPKTVIKPEESIDKNGLTAIGQVPAHIFKPLSDKFRRLQDEGDAFRRDYSAKFDQLYEQLAHETDYRTMSLYETARDYLGFDHPRAPGGARMAFIEKVSSDPRLVLSRSMKGEVENALMVLPRRVIDATRTVANWARDYQDAAARASAGKDVLPDLRANPLTQFIAKARKLISKSRTIRSFDEFLYPTRTFPDAIPSHQLIERKPTGEGFSPQDKTIITMIWDTYLRRPSSTASQTKLQVSIIALILRAVGAYPNRQLDQMTAFLFLKELGCKEPWTSKGQDIVNLPIPFLGLNHNLNHLEQRELKAANDLKLDDAPEHSLLSDSLADIRKDWKDMKAFAVDPLFTQVVDDAFSIEPSAESPDLTWIHMHVAHPSAFIPPHHDLLARPETMIRAYYGNAGGSIHYFPKNLMSKMVISDKRPTPVITVSTLIHADGTVHDVQVAAATLRNTLRVDVKAVVGFYNKSTLFHNFAGEDLHQLEVGKPASSVTGESYQGKQYTPEQQHVADSSPALCQEHAKELRLIDTLLRARFEARKRESPDHLRAPRDVNSFVDVIVDTSGEPDTSFDRILKSEHCYGDPHVLITRSTALHSTEGTYADYAENLGTMYHLRLLATESLGFFTRKHQIPVIYTVVEPVPEFPMEALNSAGPHDRIAWPITGKSLRPGRHVFSHLQQQVTATSPLRQYIDLVNQYQITAFVKSQALQSIKQNSAPSYPYSEVDLKRVMENALSGVTDRLDSEVKRHWVFYTLYHSWRHDANFPKLLDARLLTTLPHSAMLQAHGQTAAYLFPWPIRIYLEPSEQGYEKSAKAAQYLPIKITSINPSHSRVTGIAIGPASDKPNFPQNFLQPKKSAVPSTDER